MRAVSPEEEPAAARAQAVALAVALLIACGLATAQYLANPSLGVDEIAVVLNLQAHSVARLISAPLDYAQVAPPGWLVIEKGAGVLGGYSELSLRFFPFLMALAAVVLLAHLARRVGGGFVPAMAVAWLGTSLLFLQFAAAVKQYTTDVVAVLLLTLLALDLVEADAERPGRRALAYGAIGVVVLLLSQAAVFVVAGLGAAIGLIALVKRDRALVRRAAPALALWVGAAAAVTLVTLRASTPGLMAYMQRFWSAAFVPFPPRSVDDLRSAWRIFRDSFLSELAYDEVSYFPKLFAALLVIGAVSLARRRWDVLALLVGPIAATGAASALHRYPFGGRVGLFLHPAILILIALGADSLRRMIPRRGWPVAAAGLLLLFVPRARMLASQLPPYWWHDSRPMLADLARATRAGDIVYLHHTAGKPFLYYGPRADLRDRRIVHGSCSVGNPIRYVHEIDGLRGAPSAWVVLVAPQHGEEPLIRYYLDAIGSIRDSIVVDNRMPGGLPGRSIAWHYDLSDPRRLASIRSDTLELPKFMVRPEFGWVCYGFRAEGQDHPSLQP